jgi:hypothetical protein
MPWGLQRGGCQERVATCQGMVTVSGTMLGNSMAVPGPGGRMGLMRILHWGLLYIYKCMYVM